MSKSPSSANTLVRNARRVNERSFLKNLRNNLHSVEIYYRFDERTVRLLKTCHDSSYFTGEQWAYLQQKTTRILKEHMVPGKSKTRVIGHDLKVNCYIVCWKTGLAATCLTSRLPNKEMPELEDEIAGSARSSESQFLQVILDKYAKKNPASQWAHDCKLEVEDSKLKKHDDLLNQIFSENLIEESKKRAALEDRNGTLPPSLQQHQQSGESSSTKWFSKKAVMKFVNNVTK